MYQGQPHDPVKTCENMKISFRCLKVHFQRFFKLRFLHLVSNGLNGVNINNSLMFVVLLQIFVYLVKTHKYLISSNTTQFQN